MERLENNNKKMIANKPANQQPKLGQEWKNECKEMGEQRDAIRPPSESTPITARPCFSTCWGGMGRGDHNSADLDKRLNLEGNVFNTMFCI